MRDASISPAGGCRLTAGIVGTDLSEWNRRCRCRHRAQSRSSSYKCLILACKICRKCQNQDLCRPLRTGEKWSKKSPQSRIGLRIESLFQLRRSRKSLGLRSAQAVCTCLRRKGANKILSRIIRLRKKMRDVRQLCGTVYAWTQKRNNRCDLRRTWVALRSCHFRFTHRHQNRLIRSLLHRESRCKTGKEESPPWFRWKAKCCKRYVKIWRNTRQLSIFEISSRSRKTSSNIFLTSLKRSQTTSRRSITCRREKSNVIWANNLRVR